VIVLSKINLQLFAEEKTEPATPKRRQDARKKGQVFQSREITSALVIVAGFLAVNILTMPSLEKMMALTKYLLYTYSGANDDVFNVVGIRNLFTYVLQQAISIIMPIILLIFVVSLASTYLQVGFVFTTEPLAFKLERLNPVEGFKRIFSKRALVELAKSIELSETDYLTIEEISSYMEDDIYYMEELGGEMREDEYFFPLEISNKLLKECKEILNNRN